MTIFPEAHFVIDEDMREELSHRTCDRRSSSATINDLAKARFPEVVAQSRLDIHLEGQSPDSADPRWGSTINEGWEAHTQRTIKFVHNLFEKHALYKSSEPIAFAGHYGTIPSLFESFGAVRPAGNFVKGQVVAMVVKVTELPTSKSINLRKFFSRFLRGWRHPHGMPSQSEEKNTKQ